MNRFFLGLAGVVSVAVLAGSAAAHHSAAPFDFSKSTSIQGTVKRFQVSNPHVHALLTITDRKGTRDVDFEGHSASNFFRAGYKRGSVRAGDRIKITYAPRRDGTDGGFILDFTTAQGQRVGFSPL